VVPIKKCKVGTPNNFIIPSGHVTTSSSATLPTHVKLIPSIQNNKAVANRPTVAGLNIALHDQQVGPSSQLKKPTIIGGTNYKFVNVPLLKVRTIHNGYIFIYNRFL